MGGPFSRAICLFAVIGLTGCGGDKPGPPITCTVGTGISDFMPLADGDAVDIAMGPQGGYHIWTSVRITGDPGLAAATVVLDGRFADSGASIGSGTPTTVLLRTDASGAQAASGLRTFVSNPAAVRGMRVTIGLSVTTSDGRHCADQRTVVAQ
jgi:hypothetical protein